MADFDPSTYLTQVKAQPGPSFDPSQYLSQVGKPPTLPDAADKTANGGKSFLDSMHMQVEQLVKSAHINPALGSPEQALSLAVGQGMASMGGLPGYLGKSGMGPSAARVGLNTGLGVASGAAQNPQDRVQGAIYGGAMGAAGGALGEAAGGLIGGIKNAWQTRKMANDLAGTQDQAISAIDDATGKLKSSEAENLAHYLGNKTINIDTTRIRGVNPEIDSILSAHASKVSPYGDIPSELPVPGVEANKIRSLLDQEMTYKKLGPYAQNAETAARDAVIKPQADQLRAQIHSASPEVSDTLDQWSDNLSAARNLDKRAETAPMTVLTSPSIDRRALLQKVDAQAGTNLTDLGKQLESVKEMSNATHNGFHPLDWLKAAGKAGKLGAAKGGEYVPVGTAVGQSLFDRK